ncbi:hypothetical protein B0187_02185 [Haemophilus paracuniculus]|uniref:Solute-binding protein family 5 domain-containing protein n=1 Tax=Haemophilus paracuniculus TaxID=734 RepID=A0A1T0AUY4_9PAST|nr:peptide ABC transporter substrate-binding protein [Haemophilus paracuniculus]OOS00318.1 hypothetical protein B0187_02185 [Haemophilus paracuniculus]
MIKLGSRLTMQAVRFAKILANLTACCLLMLSLTGCEKSLDPQTSETIVTPQVEPQIEQQIEPTTETESRSPKILNRGLYGTAFELDPLFATTAADTAPIRDLFIGLMRFNVTGEIVPGIASEWFTDDGKTWIFMLNELAEWSNGQPVTAQDFVASWQRLIDPKNRSPLAAYLIQMGLLNAEKIQRGKMPLENLGVSAFNAHTLIIDLERPNFQLAKMLAHSALLPTFEGKTPNPEGEFISNGDYKIVQRNPHQLTLKARQAETAFQQVNYHLLDPHNNKNPNDLDLLENPEPKQKQNIVNLPRLCRYSYEFNFKDPLLNQKAVRQAIKTAVMSTTFHARFGKLNFNVLPDTFAIESNNKSPSMLVEQLLTQAGVTPDDPLRLNLSYNEQPLHNAVADQLVRSLMQSDLFRIIPQMQDPQALEIQRKRFKFQLIHSTFCADYPDPAQFLMPFHSKDPNNFNGYHNSELDEKLERLTSKALTDEDRVKLIQQIVQQLQNDVVVLPLFQLQRQVMVDPSLTGIESSNQSEIIYSRDLSRQKPEQPTEIGIINEPTD